MADTMMEIQSDGTLKINVDEGMKQYIADQFAAHDVAAMMFKADGSDANRRQLNYNREPDIRDLLGGDVTSPCNNGWDFVSPEEIGALIDESCTIIAEDTERDEHDNHLIKIHGHGGAVFYDNFYAIRNPMRDIATTGFVIFWRAEPVAEDEEGGEAEEEIEPDFSGNWMKDILDGNSL